MSGGTCVSYDLGRKDKLKNGSYYLKEIIIDAQQVYFNSVDVGEDYFKKCMSEMLERSEGGLLQDKLTLEDLKQIQEIGERVSDDGVSWENTQELISSLNKFYKTDNMVKGKVESTKVFRAGFIKTYQTTVGIDGFQTSKRGWFYCVYFGNDDYTDNCYIRDYSPIYFLMDIGRIMVKGSFQKTLGGETEIKTHVHLEREMWWEK